MNIDDLFRWHSVAWLSLIALSSVSLLAIGGFIFRRPARPDDLPRYLDDHDAQFERMDTRCRAVFAEYGITNGRQFAELKSRASAGLNDHDPLFEQLDSKTRAEFAEYGITTGRQFSDLKNRAIAELKRQANADKGNTR